VLNDAVDLMIGVLELLEIIFLYTVPLYIANSTPVIVHGKIPIDFGKNFFGKPILGKGKTFLGAFAGVLAGSAFGALIIQIFPFATSLIPNYFALAVFLSIGAILGDIVKSFFKRRFGIESGQKWVLADQLDFILGGIVLSLLVRVPEYWLVLLLLFATFFIHCGVNLIAYKLKLKKVPW
jgi:CDP-2,3-bis-(O-geranylgeranyl)-sn-glycerol synthase